MKITVDLDVLLDVAQHRQPHYSASEEVLSRARTSEYEAVLPGHTITTFYYVVEKSSNTDVANEEIDELMEDFVIYSSNKEDFLRARQLGSRDFEDAVVASVAEATGSDYIITRNTADFANSPVPALEPNTFLELLAANE